MVFTQFSFTIFPRVIANWIASSTPYRMTLTFVALELQYWIASWKRLLIFPPFCRNHLTPVELNVDRFSADRNLFAIIVGWIKRLRKIVSE